MGHMAGILAGLLLLWTWNPMAVGRRGRGWSLRSGPSPVTAGPGRRQVNPLPDLMDSFLPLSVTSASHHPLFICFSAGCAYLVPCHLYAVLHIWSPFVVEEVTQAFKFVRKSTQTSSCVSSLPKVASSSSCQHNYQVLASFCGQNRYEKACIHPWGPLLSRPSPHCQSEAMLWSIAILNVAELAV